MERGRALAVGLVIVLAGCAGAFGSEIAETATEDPTATATVTPSVTATPTPKFTTTETEQYTEQNETKLAYSHGYLAIQFLDVPYRPKILNLTSYARSVDISFSSKKGDVILYYTVPSSYTIQRAEMEWAQQIAFTLNTYTTTNESLANKVEDRLGTEAADNIWLHRPSRVILITRSERGNNLTKITIDSDFAVRYSEGTETMRDYIRHINRSRVVYTEELKEDSSLSLLAELRRAEYEPLLQEQIRLLKIDNRITQSEFDYTLRLEPQNQISELSDDIHYNFSSSNFTNYAEKRNIIARTYWQAILNSTTAVSRYPERISWYGVITSQDWCDHMGRVPTEAAFKLTQDGRPNDSEIFDYFESVEETEVCSN